MTGDEHTEHVEAEPTAEQSHAPEFVYTDVAAGANYCFDVRAANRYGDSPWAPRACASTMHLLPAAPSGVTAAATGPTTILVTWTDNSGNEDGFHVTKNGYLGTKSVGASVTSYVWTGLTPGTEGCFRVRAYNSYGTSAHSLLACATTPASDAAHDSGRVPHYAP